MTQYQCHSVSSCLSGQVWRPPFVGFIFFVVVVLPGFAGSVQAQDRGYGEHEIWSAILTVSEANLAGTLGYGMTLGGALSTPVFSYKGIDYTIEQIHTSGVNIVILLDKSIESNRHGLILYAGTVRVPLKNAVISSERILTWTYEGDWNWNAGEMILCAWPNWYRL